MAFTPELKKRFRYRGRAGQVPVYLGKHLRGFVFQNDWKVLPISALIAALVSMVVRRDFFLTMEGTLKGAFALTCVAIWNGFFNSIQVICRERSVVKREHRAGMHISSYVFSHMVYQMMLCLAQTVLTVYVCRLSGIQFPDEGMMTPWMTLDIGITVFLISCAADMLSLFISALAHSTTAAMTVMPFLLIFQLVFSGGIFSLPSWATNLSKLTVSSYGLKCIAAQGDYNNLPMATGWNTLARLEDDTVSGEVSIGQIADLFERGLRQSENASDEDAEMLTDIINSQYIQKRRDVVIPYSFRIGDVIDVIGKDAVRSAIESRTAAAGQISAYEKTKDNVIDYWGSLILIMLLSAAAATVTLEFIDRDKR